MRIIAGKLGNRIFDKPRGNRTHPMSERARGGLFNSLGPFDGERVLDAFSGSGALAFEAYSRGAREVIAVERDPQACASIAQNIEKLGIADHVQAIRANVSSWSDRNRDERFDLIFCDPPYDKMQLPTVEKLVSHLNSNGLMVLSYPGRESAPAVNGVVVVDISNYGDAALAYYRKTKT